MGRGRSRSDSRSRSRGRGKSGRGDDTEHIQQMVDERQAARRDRDFDKADRMREELKELGVRIDDTQLTWNAPGGMRGGGEQSRWQRDPLRSERVTGFARVVANWSLRPRPKGVGGMKRYDGLSGTD